jgi:transcription-repair coupling factor (superfamily II helicase)
MSARGLGIERLDAHRGGVRITFSAKTTVDPMSLIRRVQQDPETYRLEGETVFRMRAELEDPSERIAAVEELLAEFAAEAAAD